MNPNSLAEHLERELERLEADAIRLVESGYTVRQVADRTGLGEPHIEALLVRRTPCRDITCGVSHGAGRPRRGWINLRRNGVSLWFCSMRCVARWAAR